ncbi:uncharacterized protein J4E92_009855 [Alternaria infectoria]|uniref:uncharacterized protein n=1 Tax=Alternaria infectoria TaxID=45303 RepID=UPI0022206805|nr:uncharacterized protein J4E92_009855 [Alternaria infectoria]KAI4913232.1 hypothetical protein J4E92_009855 [Alternaria infectoria]
MEKIKSVLHGHKKDETAAHDAPTSSSTAEGQEHPIYDSQTSERKARNDTPGEPMYNIKTTSGAPYTDLAHGSGSAGLHGSGAHGTPTHVGTDGPIGTTAAATGAHDPIRTQDYSNTSQPLQSGTATAGGAQRPDAYPYGHTADPSVASIKSGVIGFGPGANQGHAAMSTHNPTQEYLGQDQVVGGGDHGTAGMIKGAGMTEGTGVNPGQTYPQSSAIGGDSIGASPAYAKETQPYENTLRQESYTADTDRSFPLAGGVISKPHQDPPSTQYPTEHTSPLQNKGIGELDSGTREVGVGVHDSPSQDSYGREGLAGAAAAATAIGASQAHSQPERQPEAQGARNRGLHTRQLSYRHVAPGDTTGTPQTGNDSSQPTSSHHPEALAAATAAATTAAASNSSALPASTQGNEHRSRDVNAAEALQPIAGAPMTGMSSTGERPVNPRLESHRHIPGEYIATPSDEKTFLNYAPVIQSSSTDTSAPIAAAEPTSTLDPSHVQHSSIDPTSTSEPHELRHTGTLGEPQPKSADDHHYARDAAIAGGLGAGAAGLGAHAASKTHDTQDAAGSQPLYEESSPYSSKMLDPRVLGASKPEEQRFDEQRFDPSAKTETAPISGSAISGPPVSHNPSETADSQHNYGRDAAVLGTGAVGAAGMHHILHQNDTPSTATSAIPENSSYTSATGSNVAAPQPTSNFSKPLTTASTSASQPVANDHFYGATGAPAPISDTSAQQPSSGLGQTSTANAVPERHPEHHYGRDVGLAGAGAAAAGGLYAANRDNTDSGPASSTIGPHSSNAANIVDPRVQPEPSKQIHHNVGPTAEDPASRTIGPHSSNIANIVDPRVKPDPSKQKEHTTVGPHQSDTLNRLDPKVDEKAGQQSEHHYGRDAALVGGAGAAGYGAYQAGNAYGDHKTTQPEAYEAGTAGTAYGNQSMTQRAQDAINAYGDHKMTQPAASMPDQRYDPTAAGARATNPVSPTSQYNYNDPTTQSNVNRTDPNDHINRNVALGGAGFAAAGLGAGAYAGSKHDDNTTQLPLRQKQDIAPSGQTAYPTQGMAQSSYPMHETSTSTSYPTSGTIAPSGQTAYPTQGMAQSSYPMHETSTGASYPTSGTIAPHNTHTQEMSSQPWGPGAVPVNDNHDKRNAALMGGAAGAAGLGGAAYINSQNQDEREAEERLRKIAQDREKEQHRLDKEQHKHDKEVHKHDKAVAAHEKDEHRLAKEHEKEQARLVKEQHHREKELEKENEGEEKKKHGLLGFLHRDKSKKEKSTASPESSPRQSRDYSPRHSRDYGDDQPDSPRWKGKHLLHKDPPKGHPAREAMEHQQMTESTGSVGKREHMGVDGPIGNPTMISGDRETQHGVYGAHPVSDLDRDNTVTEPHTGLPMNTGRFGTGAGGTDGNPAIHGLHEHSGPAPGQSTTDWEAIKKGNTPY